MSVPRLAFFADSFNEVNGVARTSREFARFALERKYPFFCVHTGPETRHIVQDTFETFELQTSRARFRLETDLYFDLLFLRHYMRLRAALSRFQPDLIHITGPSHCGLLGAMLAFDLRVPMAASWHTNLHEYAARRLEKVFSCLPQSIQAQLARAVEAVALSVLMVFYSRARLLFAPNPELIALLASKTRRPTYPMQRGIDTKLFSPQQRKRSDDTFLIGYVGRLSPEKNVRMFADLERSLIELGVSDYRFLIVGDGSERSWLSVNMKRCQLPGVLLGAELAKAYADMDAFVFPSSTDTFGNVVLESMASGVPTIVGTGGGAKFQIESGVTGFVAADLAAFARFLRLLRDKPILRREISSNARRAACKASWAAVFERMYQVYEDAISSGLIRRPRHSSARAVRYLCSE